jgi:putative transposase
MLGRSNEDVGQRPAGSRVNRVISRRNARRRRATAVAGESQICIRAPQGRNIVEEGWDFMDRQVDAQGPEVLKRDTYTCLNYHIVFSTRFRQRTIDRAWRGKLHGYMAGALRKMGCVPIVIGGVSDHIHILVGLRPNHCLSDVMREVKHESSRWIHENHLRAFAWQKGYSAFTVSPLACEKVRQYIEAQEEHHRATSE